MGTSQPFSQKGLTTQHVCLLKGKTDDHSRKVPLPHSHTNAHHIVKQHWAAIVKQHWAILYNGLSTIKLLHYNIRSLS